MPRWIPDAAWSVKVAAALALAALVADRFLIGVVPGWPAPPVWLAQAVVVVGGLVTIGHYFWLRRFNPRPCAPVCLVSHGGLLGRVRHPMYLGDLIVLAGLALLAPGPLALAVAAAGAGAVWRQARTEDRRLAARFGSAHAHWRARTGLLLPRP